VPFFHATLNGWEGHFGGDWKVLKPGEKYVFTWIPHDSQGKKITSLREARKRLMLLSFYDLFEHSHKAGNNHGNSEVNDLT
jgi:hypothetical protein